MDNDMIFEQTSWMAKEKTRKQILEADDTTRFSILTPLGETIVPITEVKELIAEGRSEEAQER